MISRSVGAFSQREMVGCEQRSLPVSGRRPHANLKAASQCRLVEPAADDIRVRRAESQADVPRGFAETRYAAKSWDKERRVVARIEASASHTDDMLRRGIDNRYVVTSLQDHDAEHIYETVYCAVDRPRTSSSSTRRNWPPIAPVADRRSPTRCGSSCTPVYWLLLDLRAAIPKWHPLRHTQFATIRLHLLKIASRITETASRIRIALASFAARRPRRSVSSRLHCNRPDHEAAGQQRPVSPNPFTPPSHE
jgi:hypothetical protein